MSLCLCGSLIGTAGAVRIHPKAGSTAAAFLRIGAGARPVAMGEAFTAVPGDLEGVLWNPAALAELNSQVLTGTHHESFEGIRHDFAAYGRPLAPSGGSLHAWALHLRSLVPPDQERRAADPDPNFFSAPQGEFGALDLSLGASYARTLGSRGSVGATLSLLRQSIDGESAVGAGLDLGVQRAARLEGLTLGASVLNLGPPMGFGETFALPLTLRLGASYRPSRELLLTGDLSKPVDDYAWLAAGAEVELLRGIRLRAGYRWRTAGNPHGAFSGARFGAGFELGAFRLGYAFSPFGELGNAHRLSLGLPWGGVPAPKEAKAERIAALPGPEAPAAPLPAPAVPEAAAKAAALPFEVTSRPRTLTPRGQAFEVEVVNRREGESLRGLEFRTVLRAPRPIAVSVSESEAGSFEALPSTYTALRVLRIESDLDAPAIGLRLRLEADRAAVEAAGEPERLRLFRLDGETAELVPSAYQGIVEGKVRLEASPRELAGTFVLAVGRPASAPAPAEPPKPPSSAPGEESRLPGEAPSATP